MKKVLIITICDREEYETICDLQTELRMHIGGMIKAKEISEQDTEYQGNIARRVYYERKAQVKQILRALRGRFNIIVVRDYRMQT